MKRYACATFVLAAAVVVGARELPVDLSALSLEELLSIEVVIASRRPARVLHSPPTILLITQEEIRRSGVGGVPEALRSARPTCIAHTGEDRQRINGCGPEDEAPIRVDGRKERTRLYSVLSGERHGVVQANDECAWTIRGPVRFPGMQMQPMDSSASSQDQRTALAGF